MHIDASDVIRYAWIGLGIFWLGGVAFTKPAVRKSSLGARLFQTVLGVLACLLLSGKWLPQGWATARFLTAAPYVQIAGAALTVAGCLFAVWARGVLGSNWSGRPSVKAGHELIVKGPYRLARHPIYTGILFAFAGTAIAHGSWSGLAGFLIVLAVFMLKMRQEEQLMLQTFPDDYPNYRRRVKALIPGLL